MGAPKLMLISELSEDREILYELKKLKIFYSQLVSKQNKKRKNFSKIEQSVHKSNKNFLNVIFTLEDLLKKQLLLHRNAPSSTDSIRIINEFTSNLRKNHE